MRVVVESAANPFRVADSSSAQNRPEADLPNELDLDMFRDDLPDVAPEAISVDFDELIGEQRSVELGVVTEADLFQLYLSLQTRISDLERA